MTYRLYYWFKGVEPSRPGGPWWYMDFKTHEKRKEFLDALRDFLWEAMEYEDANPPRHEAASIKPISGSKAVHTDPHMPDFGGEHGRGGW